MAYRGYKCYNDYVRDLRGSDVTQVLCEIRDVLIEAKNARAIEEELDRKIKALESQRNRIERQVDRSAAYKTVGILSIIYLLIWRIGLLDWTLLTFLYCIAVWYALHTAGANDRKKNGDKYKAQAQAFWDEHFPALKQAYEQATARCVAVENSEQYQHIHETLSTEYVDIDILSQLISISYTADSLDAVIQQYKEDKHREFIEDQTVRRTDAEIEKVKLIRQGVEDANRRHKEEMNTQRQWQMEQNRLAKERNQIARDVQKTVAGKRY